MHGDGHVSVSYHKEIAHDMCLEYFDVQERVEEMWIWAIWGLLYGCDS